ncbi:hypothetical protein QJS10_CPB12g00041 [Acorus calamus]|uniref:ACT domain-containing protein ACR n=1 Tax=Acorus calamus TaxID=4465 RepID=A0AAV9DLN8_ACOCL|nr:hypothetical protein QJS10_CPB12g00041 [Acorus calamus]
MEVSISRGNRLGATNGECGNDHGPSITGPSHRTVGILIDNDACEDATVIRVDSENKHGNLLEGLELELRTKDREGLLSDITRTLTENGMCIRRAEMSIEDGMVVDNFHVTDMLGNLVEAKEV